MTYCTHLKEGAEKSHFFSNRVKISMWKARCVPPRSNLESSGAVSNETEYQLSAQLQQLILIRIGAESRRKGDARITLRVGREREGKCSFIRPGTNKRFLIRNLCAAAHYTQHRPLECFYYKGRVLIISAIKAINSDRPQDRRARAPRLRVA